MTFYLWVDVYEVKGLKHGLEGSMSNSCLWLLLSREEGEWARDLESICYILYLFLRHTPEAAMLRC